MKIAFFEIEEWQEEYLQKNLDGFEVSFFKENLEKDTVHLAKDADIACIFVNSKIDEAVLSQMPALKYITVRGTGFDQIDVEEAKNHGVSVSNVPTYGENTVAEHTFGLLLNLSRKIYKSIDEVKKSGFVPESWRGFDLKGKTLGVVGTGHIGSHVIRIAKGFEMEVIAFDVNKDAALAKQLGFTYVSFEDLLKQSDIITLHVPYNKHTHHLINSENINLIKKGAYLVNTARGGVVETDALVKALQEGIITGAGLDVLEGEHELSEEMELLTKGADKVDFKTLLQNHVLMERDNVIITPHNAFNSKEALERILETTVENIKAFQGKKPINLVTK